MRVSRDQKKKKKKRRQDATHISQLICDPRERSTESGWAHLSELDGDNAPRTLYTKLHEERAGCESAEARWQNPERDKRPAKEDKEDNRESAADVLRHGSCNGPTAGITNFCE